MKVSDIADINSILSEGVSSVIYHYTSSVFTAVSILQTGKFELTNILGSPAELQYAPKFHHYFLSTTRTRHGGYHQNVGSSAVLFQLDGEFYNTRYRSSPVDYWGDRNPQHPGSYKRSEAEDRIFSKQSAIPAKITAVDVYVSLDASDNIKSQARKLLLLCKLKKIKCYFFTDKNAWQMRDLSGIGDIKILSGTEHTGSSRLSKGYIGKWIELMQASKKSQLSSKAKDILYHIDSPFYRKDMITSLKTDFYNYSRASFSLGSKDWHRIQRITEFMRKNKLNSIKEFVEFMAKKWSN